MVRTQACVGAVVGSLSAASTPSCTINGRASDKIACLIIPAAPGNDTWLTLSGPALTQQWRSPHSQTRLPKSSLAADSLMSAWYSRWSSGACRCVSAAESPAAVNSTENGKEEKVPIEKAYPAYPTVLDVNQIRDILPHRYPFLLVDRIVEFEPGKSAVGIKNVTINDNFFPGHFPERPIMPGVLMVEALAQVGGVVMLTPEVGGSKDSFFFAGIDKVRFRKPVVAGDTLVMRMKLTQLRKGFGIAKMRGEAYVGGELVCEGDFMMALGS
ncbi:hypothetical protein CBR_g26519 [Chara braunii]|uniref:3-hydroxyacyl-[acyl-carrier-protein] dehydratase n=1 Tax=Chara braunii TaxID=69332 RepID=A0A388L855_CHABU|nr:hypothetical protein CBR_g26519 [Chara braunii]|eukprot:GBG78491.1 hypothetical protein CBR_g26519 [Chara braunii]